VLRFCIRVFLTLALVAGWQAALEHSVRHVDELGEFVHPHDGHSDGSDSGLLCDTLAAPTNCAPDAALALLAGDALEHARRLFLKTASRGWRHVRAL
jgi:hypothetical protein